MGQPIKPTLKYSFLFYLPSPKPPISFGHFGPKSYTGKAHQVLKRRVNKYIIFAHRWKPPECNHYKLNVAFRIGPDNAKVGLGVLVRDSNGAVAAALCSKLPWSGGVLQTHARSILIVLQFAYDIGLRLI